MSTELSYYATGCYTGNEDSRRKGKGIGIIGLDESDGTITEVDMYTDVRNPTYLAYDDENGFLYAAVESEGTQGSAAAFFIDEDYNLSRYSIAPGPGVANCHISFDNKHEMLFAASYHSGRLQVFQLTDGRIGRSLLDLPYTGSGPKTGRQDAPHAHQALLSPDQRYLYVCDLGSDCIWIHDLEQLALAPRKAAVEGGIGPRHMAFLPGTPYAYMLSELVGKVVVFRRSEDDGMLTRLQSINTVDDDKIVQSQPAAVKIHPCGKTLAVTNRFVDTIIIFSIDRDSGMLAKVDEFPSRGMIARDMEFSPSGKWLLIAHQESDSIDLREFDPETGLPQDRWGAGFSSGTPTCIVALQ